jgi:hypothetical protein
VTEAAGLLLQGAALLCLPSMLLLECTWEDVCESCSEAKHMTVQDASAL